MLPVQLPRCAQVVVCTARGGDRTDPRAMWTPQPRGKSTAAGLERRAPGTPWAAAFSSLGNYCRQPCQDAPPQSPGQDSPHTMPQHDTGSVPAMLSLRPSGGTAVLHAPGAFLCPPTTSPTSQCTSNPSQLRSCNVSLRVPHQGRLQPWQLCCAAGTGAASTILGASRAPRDDSESSPVRREVFAGDLCLIPRPLRDTAQYVNTLRCALLVGRPTIRRVFYTLLSLTRSTRKLAMDVILQLNKFQS